MILIDAFVNLCVILLAGYLAHRWWSNKDKS